MPLKAILKKYPTYRWIQLLKEVSEQNVSLVMCQRFGATFQCPHNHPFRVFLSPYQSMLS